MRNIALYTTMYPGGEPYWGSFLESVASQTDENFDLWVGIDDLDPDAIRKMVQNHLDVPLYLFTGEENPSAIRRRSLREITKRYNAVILVDSDDVLLPSRIEAARRGVEDADVVGCALELSDVYGQSLGDIFSPPASEDILSLLPFLNVFGFSNTVYQCATLERCLPYTDDVELMDWYVATKAWLLNATLAFDPEPRMYYRQYDENMAGVMGPFTLERIRADIPRVLRHYQLVMRSDLREAIPERLRALAEARSRLCQYWTAIQRQPERLDEHARSLNFDGRIPMWWEWVTAPVFVQQAES